MYYQYHSHTYPHRQEISKIIQRSHTEAPWYPLSIPSVSPPPSSHYAKGSQSNQDVKQKQATIPLTQFWKIQVPLVVAEIKLSSKMVLHTSTTDGKCQIIKTSTIMLNEQKKMHSGTKYLN